MAALPPDLQAQLIELDKELEEGDITQKGYQKRRTQLLAQYGLPADFGVDQRASVYVQHDHQDHRATSLAALNATSASVSPTESRLDSPSYPTNLLAPGGLIAEQSTNYDNRDSLFLSIPNQGADNRLSVGGPGGPGGHGGDMSRSATMLSADYAFNPDMQQQQQPYGAPSMTQSSANPYDSRTGTMLDQTFFSDFAGQQSYEQTDAYGGEQRYSAGEPYPPPMAQRYSVGDAFSPTAGVAPPMLMASDLPTADLVEHQMPLEPRDIPFSIHDAHNPDIPMSRFDNIAAVLRHRGRTNGKQPAYWVLDGRGREIASITWEKLASRAEKVAQVIRDKSSLYRGDRVALVYRDAEVIEFAIALLGCFIAGVVAVPINELDDYGKVNLILTSTQAHLALTTENNLKTFQRDITTHKLQWPKGVEWWKTNEFGSFHPKRKDDVPPLSVPDLAYIEFWRAPTGNLRGVVLSHRTIMHQLACLSAVVSTAPGNRTTAGGGDSFAQTTMHDSRGQPIGGTKKRGAEVLLSYLDPRQGIGMILGVLLAVYGGHTVVWVEAKATEVPGLYAHLITKYRATLMVADYPGLKRAAYNYQQDPMTTRGFKKGMEPNFQSVKLCLIDTLVVDPEFHEVLADRWLRPLRNTRAREVVTPMLCLPEHGGMVISMRDWLGGQERMGCPLKLDLSGLDNDDDGGLDNDDDDDTGSTPDETNPFGTLLGASGGAKAKTKTPSAADANALTEVLLDREALKSNEVVVLAMGEEAARRQNEPGAIRVGSFGFPIPDATLAIVDPESSLLCSAHAVGEIWVDSPSLSGGFWSLQKHTEHIFHARPYRFEPGNPTPTLIEPEFLRTGLLGTVIEGKVFALGLYEDRIRQRVGPTSPTSEVDEVVEHRYYFVQHIVNTVLRTVPKIFDCSAFDVCVNDEYLPVVVLETSAASTAPATQGGPPRQLDSALLDSLAQRCMDELAALHGLRVYCVMITAPSALPRVFRYGRNEIANMLCRRDYDNGGLHAVHVKFGVERAVQNLPLGPDPVGGVWSRAASDMRAQLLVGADRQYSGIDRREVVMDDKTSTPLNNFHSITDLIQWRVARQPDEMAYCTVDGRGKEGKGLTWRKFDTRVSAVAVYLRNKVRLRAGDHVVLMYTHSEDFVFATHACLALGLVLVPMAPMDQNRLSEDVPAFLHLVADFRVKAVLVNGEIDHLLKLKPVAQHIKQSAQVLKLAVPSMYNTSRPSKQSAGLRDLGITMDAAWTQPSYAALVWTYWTPDQRRIAVQLSHATLLGMCKVQKETCQMTSSRPVVGCVRSTTGLGFVHTCLMGIYIGTPTYLLSPVEFAQSPTSLFQIMTRYKIKDTYATPQMLDHAIAMTQFDQTGANKTVMLQELKNMMITAEGRPRADVFRKVRIHFAAARLDYTAINTVYAHVLNPMVATRSYMCVEPMELWLDTRELRRGLVLPVDPETSPRALLVQDSGMVPVSTQIAVVNPETRMLCLDGEYGEIWVDSEACATSFYGSRDAFDAERFDGHTVDGDPSITYVRTGDLGFLHSTRPPIGPNGALVEMQVLYVLGSIGETFEVNGLNHFPQDMENSVERCHRVIVPGGCAVFQAGGLLVVLVEVARKAFLASLVPMIVNTILNEHQVVVDIVAFVNRGDFPRSRLGEKQRGKILAGWVSRKMRTMAQFAIRDTSGDGGLGVRETTAGSAASALANTASVHRASLGSLHSGSLRHTDAHAMGPPQIVEQYEPDAGAMPPPHFGAVEMPADDLLASQPVAAATSTTTTADAAYHGNFDADAATPTQTRTGFLSVRNADVESSDDDGAPPPPVPVSRKPIARKSVRPPGAVPSAPGTASSASGTLTSASHIFLPGVDGRPASSDEWRTRDDGPAGVSASSVSGHADDDWAREAIRGLSLADNK